MTTTPTPRVSRAQVAAARALITLNGGENKVDPDIRRIARSQPSNGKPQTTRTR